MQKWEAESWTGSSCDDCWADSAPVNFLSPYQCLHLFFIYFSVFLFWITQNYDWLCSFFNIDKFLISNELLLIENKFCLLLIHIGVNPQLQPLKGMKQYSFVTSTRQFLLRFFSSLKMFLFIFNWELRLRGRSRKSYKKAMKNGSFVNNLNRGNALKL